MATNIIWLSLLGTLMVVPSCAQGPCDPNSDHILYIFAGANRTGNNEVKLTAESWEGGYWANYYRPRAQGRVKFNTLWISSWVLDAPANWNAHALVWWTYNLQSTGAGNYEMNGQYWNNSPYCEQFGYVPIVFTLNAQNQILRPAAPQFVTLASDLYYLGGMPSTGVYTSMASVKAGDTNGSTGTPNWLFASGGSFGTLSCNPCNNTVFTATKRGTSCGMYDVQLKTNYNGFLSDPLPIFINAPNNTIGMGSATVPYQDGYWTRIYYKTSSLCALDPPMSNYELNENFEEYGNSYSGNNWSWGAAGGTTVDTIWADDVSFTSSGCTSQPCVPIVLSLPETEVHWASQSWRVGATTPGQGARIQWNRLYRYTTRADHLAIATPCP